MISAPLPETSHLLFEALSQAGASGGRNCASFAQYSSAWRTVSVLTVMLPLASTSVGAERLEDRAGGIDRLSSVVPRPMPNGSPALWQASAAFSMASSVQPSAFGARAGRIHRQHVDAGVLLHQVDARARALDLAADGRRHGDPLAVGLAEVLDRRVDRAVLLDQLRHDVVDRLQVAGMVRRLPGRERQDVVARLRLRLGGDGQQVLVALRGDVVDLNLDLLLLAPTPRTSASEALLAPGTQWSQKPIDSLPAAFAVRTKGAATSAVVVSAVLSRNVRRVTCECIGTSHVPFPRIHSVVLFTVETIPRWYR